MSDPLMHYIDTTLPHATANVALDEALLVEAEEAEGPAVLRIWELDHLAIVLGASCRLSENVRVEACESDGVEIARRSSGGGTVLIGRGALNFSVILPIEASPELNGVESTQRFVLGRTLATIRRLVPAAEMLGSGDLTIHNRKFAGSAQRRLRRHVLVHASILYDFPLDQIDHLTLMPPRRPSYRQDRPHADFVTNLPLAREPLVAAICETWLPPGIPAKPGVIPWERFELLFATKFSKSGWIERL
jgi:lipoate---protein ligase